MENSDLREISRIIDQSKSPGGVLSETYGGLGPIIWCKKIAPPPSLAKLDTNMEFWLICAIELYLYCSNSTITSTDFADNLEVHISKCHKYEWLPRHGQNRAALLQYRQNLHEKTFQNI